MSFAQLHAIYLNVGPGSFTGNKVGIIIAKTIKLVYPKIIIKIINSLLLQTTDNKSYISIIDAKSNKSYVAVYK
jgi:tRNA A37 threonylcarbamoyladenosine modification protein TsaB